MTNYEITYLSSSKAKINVHLIISETELKIQYSFWNIVNNIDTENKDKRLTSNTLEYTLPLADLYSRRDWATGNVYSLVFDENLLNYKGIINGVALSFSLKSETKESLLKFIQSILTPIKLSIPFETATFLDMGIKVDLATGSNFSSNMEFSGVDSDTNTEGLNPVFRNLMPKLNLTGPDTLGLNQIGIFSLSTSKGSEAFNKPVYIKLKTNKGFLPKTSFLVIGTQTFKFMPIGLDAGDEVKISAGLKFYSSLTSKICKITE